MALHDSLRELVAARGAAVVDDATELRGALDDFLAEDEATIGELNLLVDAVRLGGLDRMLTMLDNGAAPAAAVAEAGAALARDRGSDDSRRASWAVAALGFALGRVDAPLVERSLPTAAPVDPKPATPPPPPPPPPTPQPSPEPDHGPGTVGSPEAVPTALERRAGSAPVPQVPSVPRPAPRRKRRSVVLLVVSFAVVLGLVGGIGLALWMERDTSTNAKDPGDDPTSTDATDDKKDSKYPDGALPASRIVVNYVDDTGGSVVWALDVRTGDREQLTFGPADQLPAISSDRTQLAYLEALGDSQFVLRVVRLPGTPLPAEGRAVFAAGRECEHARRPGWSPDGKQLAIVCAGSGSTSLGLFVADASGANADDVLLGENFSGSPTWIDNTRFVYNVNDENGDPVSFAMYDTEVGTDEPITIDGVEGRTVSHQDWSAEADKMLFLVHDEASDDFGELWVADENFENARSLGGSYAHPVWSPDGKAIAFTVDEGDGEFLATASFDGDGLGEYVPFPTPPVGEVGIPVWGSR